MSIISSKTSTTTTKAPSEFDGVWLNVGVVTVDADDNESFIRLNRCISVADLQVKKIYPNMSEDFKAQVTMENQMVLEIQEAARNLEEGSSLNTSALRVQLYKRNEEIEAPVADKGAQALGLFS